VLHSQVQLAAAGPVQMLLTENLGLVQHWDGIAMRPAILTLELYDGSGAEQDFSVLDYLFNPNATLPVSSYDNATLMVLSNAYWPRTPARFLASSVTQRGITQKHVLMGTHADQLYAMDVRYLDPRRPRTKKLTSEEIEERLVPYSEYLPILPTSFVTYDKAVAKLSSVSIEPSRLESTCLVLACGVDLFYTRMSPARKYDAMEDDFQSGLLVLALGGLMVGAIAMNTLTKRQLLEAKWK